MVTVRDVIRRVCLFLQLMKRRQSGLPVSCSEPALNHRRRPVSLSTFSPNPNTNKLPKVYCYVTPRVSVLPGTIVLRIDDIW